MRNRRDANRRLLRGTARAGGALARRLWARALRRPVDSAAVLTAAATCLIIIVNAVFLQSSMHPAPFFANARPLSVAANESIKRPETSVRPAAATLTPQPAAVRRDDPIADLIGPSPRIAAVQRALSDYGYGQLKPSGIFDDATSAAIAKFEREHRLPPTGEVCDRLLRELATMVGHPLE